VGCSPSLSGAIRVNPWSVDAVADAMYSALKTSAEHRRLRHDKHWK
jgi:trehalose 6-phosphate synthase/phosphatase